MTKIGKSLFAAVLGIAIAFAPICQAHARYHHRHTVAAAAIGGAVAGLVGAVVQNVLTPTQTVVVERPVYVEPEPVVVHETFVVQDPYYYRPVRPVRHVRRYYRYY